MAVNRKIKSEGTGEMEEVHERMPVEERDQTSDRPSPGNASTAAGLGHSSMVFHQAATAAEEDVVLLTPREMAGEFGFLVIVSGRRTGTFFKLDGPRTLIGRNRRVQVYIDDPALEGQHASVRCERVKGGPRGEFILRDLDSESGTYVNGRRITAMALLVDGDVIKVGDTEMVFKRV